MNHLSSGAGYPMLLQKAALLPEPADVIRVTGEDRIAVLHNVLTQDVRSIAQNCSKPAALLTANGRTQSLMEVFITESCVYLTAAPGLGKSMCQHLDRYVITEDVRFEYLSETEVIIGVAGVQASDILKEYGASSADSKSFIESEKAFLFRQSFFPVPGYTLIFKNPASHKINLPLIHSYDQEAFRIHHGIPKLGVDLSEENLFSESGLDKIFVSWTKGCYPGQEVVARLDAYGGLQRKLLGLHLDQILAQGEKLYDHETGNEAGTITSCSSIQANGKFSALGMIQKKYWEGPLTARTGNQKIPVEITGTLPLTP